MKLAMIVFVFIIVGGIAVCVMPPTAPPAPTPAPMNERTWKYEWK